MANAPAQAGIIPRVYKSGSIIYFEGDKSDNIYILKSGRIILTSIKLDTGEEVKEDVRQGEFFGVKSALGKYPREETAQTIGETVVLVMGLAEFERLILKNINVVRKMLRVFSNQLRRVGKMARSVLGEGEVVNPDVELFRIGEYYYKAEVFPQAQYAFKRYMEYYPDSPHADLAMKRIRDIDSGALLPSDNFSVPPSEQEGVTDFMDTLAGDSELEPDMSLPQDDFSFDEGEPMTDMKNKSSLPNISSEMDDFLSGDDSLDGLDDFSFDELSVKNDLQAKYDKGIENFDGGNFETALSFFKEITSAHAKDGNEKKLVSSAWYEAGRCQLKLSNSKEAMGAFRTILKEYPESDKVKDSLFLIGNVFESVKQNEKALAYYKKVAAMASGDPVGVKASERIRALQK